MNQVQLQFDALPPRTTKGTIVRLIEQVGELPGNQIGAVSVQGRAATATVPASAAARLVKLLDGATIGTQSIRVSLARGDARGNSGDNHGARRSGGEPFFDRLLRLLDTEAKAEAEQTVRRARSSSGEQAEKSGNSLVNLVLRDESVGLGGRVLWRLGKRQIGQPLPWTRLNAGAPVLLSEEGQRDTTGYRGVVSERGPDSIEIAFAEPPEPLSDRPLFRLDLANDEVARQRQRQALERARDAAGDRLAKLRDVLLGDRPARFATGPADAAFEDSNAATSANAASANAAGATAATDATAATGVDATRTAEALPTVADSAAWRPFDDSLDASQRSAVRFALDARDIALLHGPPGTGKTTTLVELIRQAVARGEKVLACAASNMAVDNLFERLLAAGVRAVRLGHPARVLPELRAHTLDLLVENHADVRLARQLVRQATSLRDKASRWRRARPEPGEKQALREEAKQLMNDARRLEALAVAHLLDTAEVLCATLTSLDSELLGRRTFDLAVIDEACQTTEPACWIPLLRCERVVAAGDHCQLPPTVVSPDAQREGFSVSLLERLMRTDPETLSRRLDVQYRMHASIMGFSSAEFYEGTLVAADEVAGRLLADLPGMFADEWTTTPLHFIDTAGASFDEELEPDGESRRNPGEADVVQRIVGMLVDRGLSAREIGVIAPYAAQTRLLRERFASASPDRAIGSGPFEGLEIDTVDGFQGREKEAIVISLVRSNPTGEIGFLGDVRRMNVALTRARRKLVVIGDSATLAHHDFYQRLLDYWQTANAYHSVWEFGA
jgi:superfamily I DNA and/or RNA helicase